MTAASPLWTYHVDAKTRDKVNRFIESVEDADQAKELERVVDGVATLRLAPGECSNGTFADTIGEVVDYYSNHPHQLLANITQEAVVEHSNQTDSDNVRNMHRRYLRYSLEPLVGPDEAERRCPLATLNAEKPVVAPYVLSWDFVLDLERQCRNFLELTQFSIIAYSGQTEAVVGDVDPDWLQLHGDTMFIVFPKGHRLHPLEVPLWRGSEAAETCRKRLLGKRTKGESDRIFQRPAVKKGETIFSARPWNQKEDWDFLQDLARRAGRTEPVSWRHLRMTLLVHLARADVGDACLDGIIHQKTPLFDEVKSVANALGPCTFRLASRLEEFRGEGDGALHSLGCPSCANPLVSPSQDTCHKCLASLTDTWFMEEEQRQVPIARAVRLIMEALGGDFTRRANHIARDERMPWNTGKGGLSDEA